MSTDATFEKFDPATGELITTYKNFSQAEVFAAVDAARACKQLDGNEFGFTARKRSFV